MTVDRARRRQFAVCLIGISLLSIAAGIYLVMVVAYLERRHVPVDQIGSVMALLSIVEAIATFGSGYVLRRRNLLVTLVLPSLSLAAGAACLIAQPLGALVWLSVSLYAMGMGCEGVALYATTLEHRPAGLALGTAVGWFTGLIAGGNALGAFVGGLVTDRCGFSVTFATSAALFLSVGLPALWLWRAPDIQATEDETPAPTAGDLVVQALPAWAWLAAIFTAFSLANINNAFETLFPVYGLRAGLNVTAIGSFEALKSLLAGAIRPFSGMLLQRVKILPVNSASLVGMAIVMMLVPWVGLAGGLVLLSAVFGLGFGVVRVVSATLLLTDHPESQVAGQRISYYNTALCVGAIVGPWVAGMLAARLGLHAAFIITPVAFAGLFVVVLAALARSSWVQRLLTSPASGLQKMFVHQGSGKP